MVVTKSSSKKLKPALKKTLVLPYSRHKPKNVRFASPIRTNRAKDLCDYNIEEVMEVFNRYVYAEIYVFGRRGNKNRSKQNRKDLFKTLFEFYGDWLTNFAEAEDKCRKQFHNMLK